MRIHGELVITSWVLIRRLMFEQFLPFNYQQILFKQYHNCHQGPRNVAGYVDEFRELRVRSNLEESESQEVMRFITRLKESLKSHVNIQNLQSFPEVLT